MISIVIADDHGIVREGLRRLLGSEPDFKVAGEAADGREVLEQVATLLPDVVVLDITMPRLGGLETLERLRAGFPGTRVILLSVGLGLAPFHEQLIDPLLGALALGHASGDRMAADRAPEAIV